MMKSQETTRFFWAFTLIYAACWVALPSLLIHNPLLDMIEAITWSTRLEWGYEKHPPFLAWLVALAMWISDDALWGYFMLGGLSLVACFWAVWKFARFYLPPQQALFASALLTSIYYYGMPTIEFNHNILQLPLWALFSWVLLLCITQHRWFLWCLCGVLAGVLLLTKYFSLFLLASGALALIATAEGRAQLKTYGPWLACAVCIICIMPHLLWLMDNKFITLQYGMQRSTYASEWGRVQYPVKFTIAQIGCIAGMLTLFSLLKPQWKIRFSWKALSFADRYLVIMAFAPMVLVLIASVGFNLRLRSMWGTPLWNLLGIVLFRFFPITHMPKLKSAFTGLWAVLLITPLAFIFIRQHVQFNNKTDFPGQALGREISQLWHAEYKAPLPIIAGSYWVAGNAAFYAPDEQKVFKDLNDDLSNVSMAELMEKGGVVIWKDEKDFVSNPEGWKKALSVGQEQKKIIVPWQYAGKDPLVFNVTLISPKGSQ